MKSPQNQFKFLLIVIARKTEQYLLRIK